MVSAGPLSHMLDCQLFGLEPAGHHLTNVLLHAASIGPLVPRPVANDRRVLAQRLCRGDLCHPSAARRVGRLGGRATRRAERAVFHADARGLGYVRRAAVAGDTWLWWVLGARFDGQADARHASGGCCCSTIGRSSGFGSRPAQVPKPPRARGWLACPSAGGWPWKRFRSWPWQR